MKKLLPLMLCLLLALSALAAPFAHAVFTPYISDTTGLFGGELSLIENACDQLQQILPIDIFVISFDEDAQNAPGHTAADYASIFFEDEEEGADPEIGFILEGDAKGFVVFNQPLLDLLGEDYRVMLEDELNIALMSGYTTQSFADIIVQDAYAMADQIDAMHGDDGSAEATPQPNHTGDDITEDPIDSYPWRVFDDADLFTDEEETVLQEQAVRFMEQSGYDMVIHTTDSLGGKGLVAYADDYYENVAGVGNDVHGVLIMQSTADRDYYFSTTGHMIDVLTDRRIDQLVEDAVPHLRQDDSFSAFSSSISTITGWTAEGPIPGNVQHYDDTYDATQDYDGGNSYTTVSIRSGLSAGVILVSLVIGLVIAMITTLIVRGRYTKAYIKVKPDYRAHSSLDLTHSNDTLVNTFVTSRRIETDSGSSGGGSSTHSSSSGTSHGGGGGKY